MKDMNEKEILRHVDHTLLSQEAVWDEIRQVCDDAVNMIRRQSVFLQVM